jgi:hypothetical protein
MKVIQSRISIPEISLKVINRTGLLVWYLSAIKWKKFGFDLKFYADTRTKEFMDSHLLTELYDEVDIETMNSIDSMTKDDIERELGPEDKKIFTRYFWAITKILSHKVELETNPENIIVSDIDLIPMINPMQMIESSDIFVFKKEFVEMSAYKNYNAETLSKPQGYSFPNWFSWVAQPLNVGVLHIKSKKMRKLYIEEAMKFMYNNKNENKNDSAETMCFPEQRLLGELATTFRQRVASFQPPVSKSFNENCWHTYQFKFLEDQDLYDWNMHYLKVIKDEDPIFFEKLRDLSEFKDFFSIIDEKGFEYEVPKIFQEIQEE